MLTNSPDAAGGLNDGTEVSSAHSLTPSVDRVVSLRDPQDGDKSIKMTAINIAKEAANLPRFFLAPFLTAFFLRLGGLAPGGLLLLHSVFDLCPLCLSFFGSLDLAER